MLLLLLLLLLLLVTDGELSCHELFHHNTFSLNGKNTHKINLLLLLPQVTNGEVVLRVSNGHHLLPLITAMGCSVTALIAAFVAVAGKDKALEATAQALAVFG